MNYKAFLSTILILVLVGAILVLLQQRTQLQAQVNDLAMRQETLPPPVDIDTPTELVVTDADSLYPREKLSRQSDRCAYGDCLFEGGGGIVGMTTLDAFYTTWETKGASNEPVVCEALYVKRGVSALVADTKLSSFYGEKKGVLVIPFAPEHVGDLSDLERIRESSPEAPVAVSAFIPDQAEIATDPCDGGIYVLDVRSL